MPNISDYQMVTGLADAQPRTHQNILGFMKNVREKQIIPSSNAPSFDCENFSATFQCDVGVLGLAVPILMVISANGQITTSCVSVLQKILNGEAIGNG